VVPRSKTYPELIAVRMPVALAEAIEERLAEAEDEDYDSGLSGALRDAALRAIGRGDLVIEDMPTPSGTGLKTKRRPDARWVVSPAKMTAQQKRAIVDAAKGYDVSASYLMVDALCAELSLPPRSATTPARNSKSRNSSIREAVVRMAPDLKLPVENGFSVPLELRRRVAKKLGVSAKIVALALQRQSNQLGWQVGRRRSSPPKR
jgi:hypothetical protein